MTVATGRAANEGSPMITATFDRACSETIQHLPGVAITPVDLPGIYARVARDCGVTAPEVQEAVARRDEARGAR